MKAYIAKKKRRREEEPEVCNKRIHKPDDSIYEDLYQNRCGDQEVITLQVIALERLQQQVRDLKAEIQHRDNEESQACKLVNHCITQWGLSLKAHGDFLISLGSAGQTPCDNAKSS